MDSAAVSLIVRGPISCLACRSRLDEFDCVFVIHGVEECEDLVAAVGHRDVMLLRCTNCDSILHFVAGAEFHDWSYTIH